ncbi:MAG: hypothetical protein ACE5MI_02190 [Acidimicrobiia bacterium]
MRWAALAVVALAATGCTSGGEEGAPLEATSVSAVLDTTEVQSVIVTTTAQVTVPMVPTMQLEMAFLTCLSELEADIPDFSERSARCEERVFGGG